MLITKLYQQKRKPIRIFTIIVHRWKLDFILSRHKVEPFKANSMGS